MMIRKRHVFRTISAILVLGFNFILLLLILSLFKFNKAIKLSQAPKNLTISPIKETTMNGIPLIIHQIFIHAYHDHIPLEWQRGQRSWIEQSVRHHQQRLYNEFIYMFWTDYEIDRFVRNQYPWFYEAYRSYNIHISKTDAVRYLLLYHYGGIYSDLDIECVNKSIRFILSNFQGQGIGLMRTQPYGFATDLIIAARGHPFLKYVISGLLPAQVKYPFPYITAMASTGPVYLSAKYALYKHRRQIWILNQELYGNTFFSHYGGSSWHSWDGKIIWFLYNHVKLFIRTISSIVFTASKGAFAVLVCFSLLKIYLAVLKTSRRNKYR